MNILIVEDLKMAANCAKIMLKNAGHHADIAADPGIAQEMVANNEYDGILMDLGLPTVREIENGVQLTAILRKSGFDKPIVALTAEAGAHTWQEMKAAGLNACLDKPLTAKNLEYLYIDPDTTCFEEENKELIQIKPYLDQ